MGSMTNRIAALDANRSCQMPVRNVGVSEGHMFYDIETRHYRVDIVPKVGNCRETPNLDLNLIFNSFHLCSSSTIFFWLLDQGRCGEINYYAHLKWTERDKAALSSCLTIFFGLLSIASRMIHEIDEPTRSAHPLIAPRTFHSSVSEFVTLIQSDKSKHVRWQIVEPYRFCHISPPFQPLSQLGSD